MSLNSLLRSPAVRWLLLGSAALLASATFALEACTVTTADTSSAGSGGSTAVGLGSLQVTWTIAGTTDATACSTDAASSISLQLFNPDGTVYGAATTASCTAFSSVLSALPPGSYGLKAQLLDASGNAVSTLLGPVSVVIQSNLIAAQAIDFPATSLTGSMVNATTGAITLDWTVASSTDPTQCTANGAVNLVAQLLDANSAAVGSPQTVPCSAFATTFGSLTPGNYGLNAKFVDATGADVSTTSALTGITVTAGQTAVQPVDFAATSFFPATSNTGSLQVSWTIASMSNASDCTAHTAANISLQLFDSTNTAMGAAQLDPCTSFMATYGSLPPGSYFMSAQLVDASQAPVTTLVPATPITITAGATTQQPFDFPINSFTK